MGRIRWIAVMTGITVIAVCAAGAYLINRELLPWDVNREYAISDKKDEAAIERTVMNDPRQVIISMGPQLGTVYISWSGEDYGPQYFRCSDAKGALAGAPRLTAERADVLAGEDDNGDQKGIYRYKIKLNGLEEGKTYYYEIGNGTLYDMARSFSVPEESGKTTFAYLADPQFGEEMTDYDEWECLTWNMYETNEKLDFALIGGDMVNVPVDETQWRSFLDSCSLFSMLPVMTVPGNHEGVTSNNTYKKLFHHIENGPENEAFYYFDHGCCRFLMLDSSFLTKDRQETMGEKLWADREKEIESWLRETLENSPKEWNIVTVHHPFYGMHDFYTVSPQLRQYWLPILKSSGADLVLCGHQHLYMRTQPIDGITHVMGNSGGKHTNYYRGFNGPGYSEALYGAGPNYQIIEATARRLEITSYDKEGCIIDAAVIRRRFTEKISFPYFQIF